MSTYGISEFKTRLSEILRELDEGDEVTITRRGKPWRQVHIRKGSRCRETLARNVEGLPGPSA